MNRIKEASEILEAPYYRTSMIVTRGGKCGPNPWPQHHHKARDALRSATKGERTFTSIWDRWQNDEIYRKSQLAHNWSDAWVRHVDHIVHFNIYHNAPESQREKYVNLLQYEVLTKTSRQDHYGRDQCTGKRKRNCQSCTSQKEKNNFLISQLVTGSVHRTELTPHYKSTWNG